MSNDFFDSADWTAPSRNTTARSATVSALGTAVEAGFDKLPGHAALRDGTAQNIGTFGGTATALTATLTTPSVAYGDGLTIQGKCSAAATGAATINLNAWGTKSIKRFDGTAIQANDWAASDIVEFMFNSTHDYFVLQTGADAAAAASATAAAASASAAATSATNAASSATSASGSATTATTQATNASVSAAAAAASAASGLYANVISKSAAYVVLEADEGNLIRVDATAGAVTITLPDVTGFTTDFRIGVVKVDASANAVNVVRAGTNTINGGTSQAISSQWQTVNFAGDTATGSYVAMDVTAAGGDVVGPASATDNAIPRYDLATGKLIQNSGVTIDDSNNMTLPGDLTMSGASIFDANATIAAHATTMDPWSSGNYVTLTGSAVTFTALANAPQAGAEVELYMNAAHVFTDGAVFEVDGDTNFTATAGDRVRLRAKSTTVFTVQPIKKTGAAVVGGGKAPLHLSSGGNIAGGTTTYIGLGQFDANAGLIQFRIPYACTVKNLYVITPTAPGGTDTVIATVRKDNVATSVTCTVTGAAFGASDTSNTVSFSANSLLDVQVVKSATAASGWVVVSLELEVV